MHRIVEPNALAHGVGEDGAEQCHGAPGDTTTAANDRETAWLGLLPASRANDETRCPYSEGEGRTDMSFLRHCAPADS